MTTTPMRRFVTTLAVGAVLAGGHPVEGDEPDAAAVRTRLTLGGQPLARLLRADPTRPGALVQTPLTQLAAREGGMERTAARDEAREAHPKRSKRAGAIGAGIGAGLGVLLGTAIKSYCHNESGSQCWAAIPTLPRRNAYSGSASVTSDPGRRSGPPAIGTTMYCRPSCM